VSVQLPPWEPLAEVHARLARAGIVHALGASALLHARGLAEHVRDWDVNVDVGHDVIDPLFADLAPVHFGASGVHADSKLQLFDATVEIIVQMAFTTERGIVRIPTLPSSTWRGVPVGSREAWAVAYALLGRAEKSELLFGALEKDGANAGSVARMLAEPLPADLAARLASLPRNLSGPPVDGSGRLA